MSSRRALASTVAAILLTIGLAAGVTLVDRKGVLAMSTDDLKPMTGEAVATFASGCFWCAESDFEKVNGVTRVISGFSGGKEVNPTYEDNSAGRTSHIEAIQVFYDPKRVSYRDLVVYFWQHHDPTDEGGQFADRGRQYSPAIFVHNAEQRSLAEETRDELQKSGAFGPRPVVTKIRDYENFYPAEEYHQDYYKKNPFRYAYYRHGSGRDQFIEKSWEGKTWPSSTRSSDPEPPPHPFVMPSKEELKKRLTTLQYEVTQENGTEPAFKNEYNDNKRDGIYVDLISGEPLFSSTDKYESGTGWPSFVRPLEYGNLVEKEDNGLFTKRTEVRSRLSNAHLGHVFTDGPPPTGLRYCMNSAALRFVPKEELAKEGYGQYLALFDHTAAMPERKMGSGSY